MTGANFMVISLLAFVGTLWVTFHFRSEFCRWYTIPIFAATYLPQLVLTAVIGLFGHARQVSKYVKWNPTPRN
jgi:lipopolysaccharide export LptBFGC system permease protein LptF